MRGIMTRENRPESQKNVEQVILIVYTVYSIAMSVMSLVGDWGQWIAPIVLCGMAFCWGAFLKKAKDYRFRAFLVTFMAWVNFVLYGVHAQDYFTLLSPMAGMIVLLGIYCIPEIVFISAGGSTFLLFYHAVILRDIPFTESSGDFFGAVLKIASLYLVEYVTWYLIRLQLETGKKLADSTAALKRTEQSKNDFMANVSHEIRTPINTVCGMSEMLLREDLEPAVRGEVFDIQTAGRNLLSIVSDILDFSELESGKMDLVEEPYNITSTLNDVMNMTNAQLNGKHIELIVSCDANIPSGMMGDEQKLRRVIMNLVGNAVKFTQEGCVTVTLSARREEYGVNLIVNVKDTGIGMNDAELEKLFSSFNQVDTKRNRQEGGVGLGLAISQAIVRKMGGFITVTSTPGQGSEFQFVVPQKVVDDTPIISLKNPESINVVSYINMEKYSYAAIRDGYEDCIRYMVDQLGFRFKQCRNLAELKRRLENTRYSHVFICWEEYCEDKEWFDQLAERIPVVLVLDRENDGEVSGKLLRIYKPFYAVAMAAVLNGEHVPQSVGQSGRSGSRFIAPASSILVVDDNMMNVKVVEGLLRPYQIKVFAAYSGKEALKKIESMDYDFVFMDHMMPEMDGVETMHRIRQKPGKYFQTVPIIALTANAIGGAREMFLAEGFQDFVAKPIELSVLERVLLRYIPQQKITKLSAEEAARLTEKKGAGRAVRKETEDPQVSFEGIDVKQGITYCGGRVQDYLEVVQIYYTSGIEKKKEIQGFYENRDWKNYSILVHAVKSTSLGIGAARLSDMAKELERAGKSADEAYILDHHQEMMDEYERVLDVLGADPRIGSGTKTPEASEGDEAGSDPAASDAAAEAAEIDGGELETLLSQLQEALETFESEAVEEIFAKFKGYARDGRPLQDLLEPVRTAAAKFDFMGAEDRLADIRERLG